MEKINTIEDINLILEDNCTIFAKELKKQINKARTQHKKIEYYSDNITIYSYKKDLNLGQDVVIFETVYKNRNENKVELSFIANRNMYGSHLLYLINRAELKSK